jgi:toxin YhaV
MSLPLVRHGWEIAFQPQLFARQYAELKAEVKRLKQELDPQAFAQHPQVKLLAAVMEGIKERIASDPYASRFALTGPLRRYGRLKGLGLPDRYRLFFRPFEAECCSKVSRMSRKRGCKPHSFSTARVHPELAS